MSQMDTNDTASVADTLKLRNTETAALKRMPVADTNSSASAAARKTIKLKPLTPQTTGISPESTPSSMAGASPLIKKVGVASSPSPAGEASTPQFMGTATVPVAKIPAKEKAAPPAAAGNSTPPSPALTGTTSVPRLNLTPKTMPAVPSPSPAQTISLTPNNGQKTTEDKSASTASGSIPKYVATSTSGLPRVTASPSKAGQAPKYVSTATSPIPAAAADGNASKGAPLKSAIDQAKLQSGMQGAKPAIKLRPSANPDGPASGAGSSAPTIKLTPRTESAVTPLPPSGGSTPAPRASDTMTAKISRKGVAAPKVQAAAPAAAPATAPATAPAPAPVSATAETLQMTAPEQPATPPPAATPSAPTVQLTPGVVEEAQKAAAPASEPTPSASSVDPGVTTKIPRKLGLKKAEGPAAPTVQATPAAPTVQAKPAAPTVQATPAPASGDTKKKAPTLREQEVIAKVNLEASEQEGEQTLEMGEVENKTVAEPVKKKKKKSGDGEPHMFFAVCVIIAFVVTLFTVYTLVAHYLNTWEGKKLPVVGFEQIDEHMKKK